MSGSRDAPPQIRADPARPAQQYRYRTPDRKSRHPRLCGAAAARHGLRRSL